MSINKIRDYCTIIYVLIVLQTGGTLSGTVKLSKINNLTYEKLPQYVSYADEFDLKDYNFTEYFRRTDQQNKINGGVNDSKNIMKSSPGVPVSSELKENLRVLLRTPDGYSAVRSGNSRFLDLFNVFKFQNKPCSAGADFLETMEGTCYHQSECDHLGGLALGSCAKGFGVCCVFSLGCGSMSLQNVSYFDSPGFPKPTSARLACAITVVAAMDVQQLRLDFEIFELQPPTNGTCVDDQFVISGQDGNKLPPICGINTGQHMYLDVSQSRYLMMSILTNSEQPRQFRVKITQLRMYQSVPKGCLQYYDGIQGRIDSFNYEDASRVIDTRRPGYFNNMNYAVCIGRVPGHCAVTYFSGDYFQIVNCGPDGESLIPPEQAGAEVFNCPDDYIIINGVRLCGERLNDASLIEDFTIDAPVTEYGAGPVVLPFRSNGNVTGRGFRLLYRQEPCAME